MRPVLITGDRNWSDEDTVHICLTKLIDLGYDTIIEGEARGADTIARNEALKLGITVIRCPAQWDRYGRAAGSIRNQYMLDQHKPGMVVYFHNDIGSSKGTRHMVNIAIRAGIKVIDGREL